MLRPPGRRIVPQLLVVEIVIDGIEAEAVDAALQPEAHHVEHRVLHLGVVEVEVRLLKEEIMEVILPAARIPLPGAPAENRWPVIGRGAVLHGIGPDEPVGAGIGAVEPAFAEPGMLVGCVAEHLVDDDLEPQIVRPRHQGVEILHGAEQAIHLDIIRDVVAHIRLRRLEDGREPDGVHAQARYVVEPAHDAGEVTHPVAIGILKRARINLIDNPAAPPVPHARLLQVVLPNFPASERFPMRTARPRRRRWAADHP